MYRFITGSNRTKYTFTLILFFIFLIGKNLPVLAQPAAFVKVNTHQFVINKKPYYFMGTNYWYGAILGMDQRHGGDRARLIKELDFLQKNGVTNLRVMAAVEGSGYVNGVNRVQPALQQAPGVFDEKLMDGLDFLLAEMGKRNMKAVLFLSNNWEWSGGFLQYVNWYGLVADSVVQRKLNWDEQRDITARFYSCVSCKEAYLEQVKYIVGRKNKITRKLYSNDPTIMAWELANEPRPMRPAADADYAEWITEAAAYIKSLDKNHLVTIGHEGYMATDGDMALFEKIHTDKNIDYLAIHIWAKNWSWFKGDDFSGVIDTLQQRALDYIAVHEKVAVKIKKPLVIEEFGLPRDQHGFTTDVPTRLRDQYFAGIFGAFYSSKTKKGAISGVNFWAFGGTARPVKGQVYWKEGDALTGDPPMEEQGLNSVFDNDISTWELIRKYAK